MIPLAPILAGGQIGYGLYNAARQKYLANKLRRRGPLDPTPNAFRAAQMAAENNANNHTVPGPWMDDINAGVSTAKGDALRTGTSSSDVMSGLSKANTMVLDAKRKYRTLGEQLGQHRLDRAIGMEEKRGQWQELGRQENNDAIGALEGASIQNVNNALTGGVGLLSSLNTPTGTGVPDAPEEGVDQMAQYETPEQLAQYEGRVNGGPLPERDVHYQVPKTNNTYLPQSYRDLYRKRFGF